MNLRQWWAALVVGALDAALAKTSSAVSLRETFENFQGIDLDGLVIFPTGGEIARATAAWSWLGVKEFKPLLVTAFGDIFFSALGEIVFLDTVGGDIVRVGDDLNAMRTALKSIEARDEWLREGLVLAVRNRGQILSPGECYDFEIPPVMGGEIALENVKVVSFVVKLDVASQIHRQTKDLSEGTRIDRIAIDGK